MNKMILSTLLAFGALSLVADDKLTNIEKMDVMNGEVSANDIDVLSNEEPAFFLSSSEVNIAGEGIPSAQSTFPGYDVRNINDGDTNTTVGGSYSWANGHTYTSNGLLPQWTQLAFSSQRTFSKVVLYTSYGYELKDYDIQVFDGYNWITVVQQRGNTSTSRIHTFSPTKGTILRVLSLRGPDNQFIYARINELQVYETSANLALKGTATAQSTFPGYSPSRVNDGSTNTTVGGSYSWANGHTYTTDGIIPQWLEVNLNSIQVVSKVVLYTSLGYEIKDYDIQLWTGSVWTTVVEQRGNTSLSREHSFVPMFASKVRVIGRRGPDNQFIYVRVNELEVY
ncbi:MAG: discoidin domain-containing protein [Pseudomonadota bacterium]